MYAVVLKHFQEIHWSDIVVDVNAYERNRKHVMDLVDRTQKATQGIINKYRGGDDGMVARIYLLDREDENVNQ